MITEMRFYVPEVKSKDEASGEEVETLSAKLFHSQLVERADISNAGKSIIKLDQMPFLTPR